ncbi:hypothetical protein CEXT_47131 [Caerostris extrusa]|uniref:Ribosomal protein S19 n=1 Tax=Caerostris extrusa TaxID=172846 RepID=A0AAV4WR86_CAEEX|nr:hypothetical protein CEXT_47131 [Caerostris extrusa]
MQLQLKISGWHLGSELHPKRNIFPSSFSVADPTLSVWKRERGQSLRARRDKATVWRSRCVETGVSRRFTQNYPVVLLEKEEGKLFKNGFWDHKIVRIRISGMEKKTSRWSMSS